MCDAAPRPSRSPHSQPGHGQASPQDPVQDSPSLSPPHVGNQSPAHPPINIAPSNDVSRIPHADSSSDEKYSDLKSDELHDVRNKLFARVKRPADDEQLQHHHSSTPRIPNINHTASNTGARIQHMSWDADHPHTPRIPSNKGQQEFGDISLPDPVVHCEQSVMRHFVWIPIMITVIGMIVAWEHHTRATTHTAINTNAHAAATHAIGHTAVSSQSVTATLHYGWTVLYFTIISIATFVVLAMASLLDVKLTHHLNRCVHIIEFLSYFWFSLLCLEFPLPWPSIVQWCSDFFNPVQHLINIHAAGFNQHISLLNLTLIIVIFMLCVGYMTMISQFTLSYTHPDKEHSDNDSEQYMDLKLGVQLFHLTLFSTVLPLLMLMLLRVARFTPERHLVSLCVSNPLVLLTVLAILLWSFTLPFYYQHSVNGSIHRVIHQNYSAEYKWLFAAELFQYFAAFYLHMFAYPLSVQVSLFLPLTVFYIAHGYQLWMNLKGVWKYFVVFVVSVEMIGMMIGTRERVTM